jgi:hypothetical protein
MAFEAHASTFTSQFDDVPPEWAPVFFAFDPDLPLFPRAQDRTFGYMHIIYVDMNTRVFGP